MANSRRPALALLLGTVVAASGCMFLDVKQQQELDRQVIRISGTVALSEPANGPRVVVLVRMHSDDAGDVVDHYSSRRDGRFYFAITDPGTYALAAFHDGNGNLTYDPDEAGDVFVDETTLVLAEGDTIDDLELVIEPRARIAVDGPADILELTARSANEQLGLSLAQLTTTGAILELGDPDYGAEYGQMGMWRPFDFVFEVRPGIFFKEPYDPERIPVLFIHGMTGHPNEFEFLAESLDASRFQPWFYFYPSGASLEELVNHAQQVLMTLRARHRFRRLVVVAHSMGGLLGRGLVLEHEEANENGLIRLFVTIATPWGGQESAQAGVDRAPAVVDSWRDIAPDSAFQRWLFWLDPEAKEGVRPLPEHVSHHLLFGFQRDTGKLGASSDSVVTLESQLFPAAQAQAVEVFGFDATHAGILQDPATAEKLNRILEEASR